MTMLEPGVAGAPTVDFCQRDGCEEALPQPHHPMRKYCDEHQPKKPKADKAPPSVTVNVKMPAAKTTKIAKGPKADVIAGATSALTFVSFGFSMVGDAQCAAVVQASAPNIANQLGELAEYHPGLAKIFAASSISGEAGAWIGLSIAIAPVVIAILVHHDLIPPALAERLAGLAGAVMSMTPATTEEPTVTDEAPQSVADAA
jgi:hypothetical protein